MSMYRKEWDCCGSVTETNGWELESCLFCKVEPVAATLPAAPAPTEDFHISVSVEPSGTHVQVWDGETKLYEQFHEMPAPAPTEQQDELPITRSTYGSLEACEAEQARRNAALTEQAESPYRVYEFWSSASPGTKVRMLAEGDEIDVWPKRGDFIRDVTVAARPAPTEAPKEAITGGQIDNPEDAQFYRFWYSHMRRDQMTGALSDIKHSTARYIWDAARQAPDGRDAALKILTTAINQSLHQHPAVAAEILQPALSNAAIAKEKAQ